MRLPDLPPLVEVVEGSKPTDDDVEAPATRDDDDEAPTLAPSKGEEHKKKKIEGVVEHQAGEELVKKDGDEAGEDLRQTEL